MMPKHFAELIESTMSKESQDRARRKTEALLAKIDGREKPIEKRSGRTQMQKRAK
jgi:hypothetical protein